MAKKYLTNTKDYQTMKSFLLQQNIKNENKYFLYPQINFRLYNGNCYQYKIIILGTKTSCFLPVSIVLEFEYNRHIRKKKFRNTDELFDV